MTVETTESLVRYAYTGPGAYDFSFRIFDPDDIVVTYVDTNGSPTTLDQGIDLDVTAAIEGDGGSVVVTTPAVSGGVLEIRRVLALSQPTSWGNSGPLSMALLEQAFDRSTMILQQLKEIVDGSAINSTWRGDWTVGVLYNAKDVVRDNTSGSWYQCSITHVAEDFALDVAAGNWYIALDLSALEARVVAAAFTAVSTIKAVPAGTVLPFIGGYFTDSSNGWYTNVLGNDAATLNARLNPEGYYVCNGAAINLTDSPIFHGAGRCLPNLTDSRFLMGASAEGQIGGVNTTASHTHTLAAHSHTTGDFTLLSTHMPAHFHSLSQRTSTYHVTNSGSNSYQEPYGATDTTDSKGGGAAHNHGVTSTDSPGVTGSAAGVENRPQFLSCIYIMKAI